MLGFTENKGQIFDNNNTPKPNILFNGTIGDMSFFLKKNSITYQLYRTDTWAERNIPGDFLNENKNKENKKSLVPDKVTVYRLDVNWLNCNTNAIIDKAFATGSYDNYYPSSGTDVIIGVKTFGELIYRNIYKGIDLKWYYKNGQLKYDYILNKGTDYKQIKFEVKGAEQILINEHGDLIYKTLLGDIIEQAPVVVQEGKELKAKWLIKDNVISFEIENLSTLLPFVIDPGVKVWGTYYGGKWDENGFGCSVDKNGNVYFAGVAPNYTNNIISTPGSFQTSGSAISAFLAKFNSLGQRLWGTYYGGGISNLTYGRFCSTDHNGNIYLAGITDATNNTATINSHQSNFGGNNDAFLVKFDSTGMRLWATYYGGIGYERGNSCTTDTFGNVYLAGICSSETSISSSGANQTIYGGGNSDAFLVKFSASGQRLWATYYGGIKGEEGNGCTTDSNGNVYLTGNTDSNTSSNISTNGSHQSTYTGNENSAFLVKFNSSGQRLWGTYYGANLYTTGYACSTDAEGNVYMTGLTNSNTGISTSSSYQPAFEGGVWDGFLVKFNTAGFRQWATYYGGPKTDVVRHCVTDVNNNIYICGYSDSNSGSIIGTQGTEQPNNKGASDAFLASFSPNGVRHWATYYGGPHRDHAFSCTLDYAGNIYLSGFTELDLGNTLSSFGSHQSTFGGREDALFVKFDNCIIPSPTNLFPDLKLSISSNSLCSGQSVSLNVSGANSYTWMPGPLLSSSLSLIANSGINYTVTGLDTQGCKNNLIVNIPVTPTPTLEVTPFFYLCNGSATLTAKGAQTFSWLPTNLTGSFILVSPNTTINYTLIGANKNCTSSAVSVVSIGVAPPYIIDSSQNEACKGTCFTFSNTSNLFYDFIYIFGDSSISEPLNDIHCYTQAGNYQVKSYATYTSGCHVESANTLSITIFPLPALHFKVKEPYSVNKALLFQNLSTGADQFKWSFGDNMYLPFAPLQNDFNYTYSTPNNYCIKLIGIDTVHNCIDSLTKCIDVQCNGEINLPNVFSPNNDGLNDGFWFRTNCIKSLKCTIYNRWGSEIYSWTGTSGLWDGRTNEGWPVSDGTYFYSLEYVEENNKLVKKLGSILLIR